MYVLRVRGLYNADTSRQDADVWTTCCLLVVAHALVGQMLSEADAI